MRDDEPRVIGPGFHGQVYEVVRRVPLGRVTTYGDVAAALGSPRVARQVGWALAACEQDDVPWQRVVNAKGMISFKGDTPRAVVQRALLEHEGLTFDAAARIRSFAALRWRPSPGEGPPDAPAPADVG